MQKHLWISEADGPIQRSSLCWRGFKPRQRRVNCSVSPANCVSPVTDQFRGVQETTDNTLQCQQETKDTFLLFKHDLGFFFRLMVVTE